MSFAKKSIFIMDGANRTTSCQSANAYITAALFGPFWCSHLASDNACFTVNRVCSMHCKHRRHLTSPRTMHLTRRISTRARRSRPTHLAIEGAACCVFMGDHSLPSLSYARTKHAAAVTRALAGAPACVPSTNMCLDPSTCSIAELIYELVLHGNSLCVDMAGAAGAGTKRNVAPHVPLRTVARTWLLRLCGCACIVPVLSLIWTGWVIRSLQRNALMNACLLVVRCMVAVLGWVALVVGVVAWRSLTITVIAAGRSDGCCSATRFVSPAHAARCCRSYNSVRSHHITHHIPTPRFFFDSFHCR